MGREHPLPRYGQHNHREHNDRWENNDRGRNGREKHGNPSSLRHDFTEPDVQSLMEENTQLRKLVTELSGLVAKNVMLRR